MNQTNRPALSSLNPNQIKFQPTLTPTTKKKNNKAKKLNRTNDDAVTPTTANQILVTDHAYQHHSLNDQISVSPVKTKNLLKKKGNIERSDLDNNASTCSTTPNVRSISINGCTFTINNNVYSVSVVLNGQDKENHDTLYKYHNGTVSNDDFRVRVGLIVDQLPNSCNDLLEGDGGEQQQPTSCTFIKVIQTLFTRQADVRENTRVYTVGASIHPNLLNNNTALNKSIIMDVINAQRFREASPSLRTLLPLKPHRNFNFNDRLNVVNKMAAIVFNQNWPFSPSILFVAVNYLDRFLVSSKKKSFNILAATEVGIVCINLAGKMDIECDLDNPFDSNDQKVLVKAFDRLSRSRSSRSKSRSRFFNLQRVVLRSLSYRLLVATPTIFLKEFLLVQCSTEANVKEIALL